MPGTDASRISDSMPCCVFVDLTDLNVQNPFPFWLTLDMMKVFLEKKGLNFGEISIMVYVDSNSLVEKIDGGKLTLVRAADPSSLITDIVLWAMENPAKNFEPSYLVLVSDNITDLLSNALRALNDRYYNVLILPINCLRGISCDDRKESNLCDVYKWKSRKDKGTSLFSKGIASLYKSKSPVSLSDIALFWDLEGRPINDDEFNSAKEDNDKEDSYLKILSALRRHGYKGDLLIRGYVGKETETTRIPFGNHQSHVTFVSVSEYAKHTRMLLDMMFWAMNNIYEPSNLILLTKPSKSSLKVLEALEERGFNVIFPSTKMRGITLEGFEKHFITIEKKVMTIQAPHKIQPPGRVLSPFMSIFVVLDKCYPKDAYCFIQESDSS